MILEVNESGYNNIEINKYYYVKDNNYIFEKKISIEPKNFDNCLNRIKKNKYHENITYYNDYIVTYYYTNKKEFNKFVKDNNIILDS
jgi:hypothetical protein